MAGSKLNGALRWSAAEEVAVRISAVRSQVAAAATADAADRDMSSQLRSGLSEIDSIRKFIHDGISMCHRQYVDGGSRDTVLQGALEKGLSELEEVRSKLVATMHGGPQRGGGESSAPAASSVRRPPSAPTRNAVQREIEAKKQQRLASELQRKSFLERLANSAATPAVDSTGLSHQQPAVGGTASRPSSATQRGAAPSQAQGLKLRPTSATVRSASVGNLNLAANGVGTDLHSSSGVWGSDAAPQPAPPRGPNTQPATPGAPQATGLKFRPSSAPNQRQKTPQELAGSGSNAGNVNGAAPPGGVAESQKSDGGAWGKYQDWAQSVLSRVQSRRVLQHRQAMQKQREESAGASGAPAPTNAGQQPPIAAPATPPAAAPTMPQRTTSTLGPGSIVQGNIRRARPSTAGLTPAGGVTGNASTTNAGLVRPQSAKLNPQAQMYREQGNVLFQQKKYRESAEAYSRAIECDPHSETLFCNRAAAFLMLNKYSEALHDSLKAIEFDPAHVKAHWRAAKAYLYLCQSDEARSMYQQALRLASVQTESEAIEAEMKAVDLAERCRRHLKSKEWQDALRVAESVLEIFPPSGPCSMPWQCLRAEALIHVDAHEAGNQLAQMTSDDPTSAEAWYLRAKALFYTGHDGVSTNGCLQYLQKSRELDPSNRAAALQLCIETFAKLRDEGNSAYSGGRWQDAHAAYTRCLTVDAYNTSLKAIILCNRAAVSIQCEKWKDALDDINQSIAFNPHNAKAYTRRARIYQHNGQFDLAVKDLQLAVQMYPSSENQERLTQAIEMKTQAARQQAQKQHQQYQQQQQPSNGSGMGGAGGSFRYFGFASGGGGTGFSQQSRPSTAGTRRPQSAGYGGESNNGYNAYHQQQQQQQQRAKSYYEILCITRTSDEKAVVRAYRDAALKWHPDKWASATAEQKQHAENVFKEVSVAYNTLKDPQKRRQYDLSSPN